MSDDAWQVIDVNALREQLADAPVKYQEFLKVPSLSCGLYKLAAGSTDMQSPHDEDEVYFVLDGRAKMRIGGEERSVGPGTFLYVSATEEHSFFEIEEDMTLLVLFAAS